MYVIAFTEGSLAWIVCTMGTMMHPIIAISLGMIVHKCAMTAPPLRFLKYFTMSFYFCIITAFEVYLTFQWNIYKEHKITEKLNKTENKNLKEIGAFGKRFDQCGCSEDDGECILPDESKNSNIVKYTREIVTSDTVPYFLIGFTTVQIIWFLLLELCRNEGIPILQFLLGPKEWLQLTMNQGKSAFEKIGDCFRATKKFIFEKISDCSSGITTFLRSFCNSGNANSCDSIPLAEILHKEKEIQDEALLSPPSDTNQTQSPQVNEGQAEGRPKIGTSCHPTPLMAVQQPKVTPNNEGLLSPSDSKESYSSQPESSSSQPKSSSSQPESSSSQPESSSSQPKSSSSQPASPPINEEKSPLFHREESANDENVTASTSAAKKDIITSYFDSAISWYDNVITFSRRFHNAGNAMYLGSESHHRNVEHPKQRKIGKCKLVLCCLIFLTTITSILLIPNAVFNNAMVWKNTICIDEYYDVNTNSSVKVPKCTGNFENCLDPGLQKWLNIYSIKIHNCTTRIMHFIFCRV